MKPWITITMGKLNQRESWGEICRFKRQIGYKMLCEESSSRMTVWPKINRKSRWHELG